MKRLLTAIALIASLALTGCGSSDDNNDAATECTNKTARELTQTFITSSKFDVECATVKVSTPFYFVNNDETTHTVTTDAAAPEQFDAELPKKTSTYSHTFAKTGTYKITCKRHNETMTLIVS